MKESEIKKFLEKNYLKYKSDYSSVDPVWGIRRLKTNEDIEAASFITACYSYGRVEIFEKFLHTFFEKTGFKVHDFIVNYSHARDKAFINKSNYRFNTSGDFEQLILILKKCYRKYGSLKNIFLQKYDENETTVLSALQKFSEYLNSGSKEEGTFRYLIPLPSKGSACKRLNLFLRWMVRNDEIDLGIWSDSVSKSKLIMPVDIHIYRISRQMGFVKRASADMKFALELTSFLRRFDADDPVKYDFALCHIGIDEHRK